MTTVVNLLIEQGTTYLTFITVTDDENNPNDLTGYTFYGSMKRGYGSSNSIPFVFEIANTEDGVVSFYPNTALTASANAGRYVYDIYSKDSSNNILRILEGIATLTPKVTTVS